MTASTTAVHALHWSIEENSYELTTNNAAFSRKAALLFDSWRCKEQSAPVGRWHVEKLPSAEGEAEAWELYNPDGEVLRRETAHRALLAVEYDSVRVLFESLRYVSLHSALLEWQGQGVLLVGPCHSGKSTLSCALWQSGFGFAGDDMTLLDLSDGAPRVRSSARRVSLREGSRELLGEVLWQEVRQTPSCTATAEGIVFHPHELQQEVHGARGRRSQALPLGGIFFLARRGVELPPATSQRIEPTQAVLSLLPYSNLLHEQPAKPPFFEAMRKMAKLTEWVPTYDLSRGPLPEMIEEVTSRLREPATART